MAAPRLSILLPNFNNGPEASRDGQTHFLRRLFDSFYETLDGFQDWEFIVLDDGSTDSGLEELTRRERLDPRIRVIRYESNSGGHIAKVMNELVRMSTAPVLLKIDGDITFRTKGWAQRLLAAFDRYSPEIGILGAMQYRPQGDVQGCGDYWLHPKGYHHIGKGMPPGSLRLPLEVDAVMACFMAFRREVWERSPFDESFVGRGADEVHFEFSARRAGFRIWTIPSIEFVHHHSLRAPRSAAWDISSGDRLESEMIARWGFGYHPDLTAVRERYAGGDPLLWNVAWFDPGLPELLPPDPYACFERVAIDDPSGARAVVHRLEAELQHEGVSPPAEVLVMGAGDDWIARHLQQKGFGITNAVLLNPSRTSVESLEGWPYRDGYFAAVLLPLCLERTYRPIVLLREAMRVVQPGGTILIVTTYRNLPGVGDPLHHYIEFSPYELAAFCYRETELKRFDALGPFLLGVCRKKG